MSAKQEKKPSFEEAIEKLEQIVSGIESGEVSLEESIEKYAEGMKLIKSCREILDKAENKIKVLSEGENGKLQTKGELPEME